MSRVPAFLALRAVVVVVGCALQSATASSTRSFHDAPVRHAAQASDGDGDFGDGVDEGHAADARRGTGSAHAGAPVGFAAHLLGACAAILAAVLVLPVATRAFLISNLGLRPVVRLARPTSHPVSSHGGPDHQELCVQLC